MGHWGQGLFPNFEGGAYVEHDSLESLNPHFVNICFNRDVRLHRSFHGPVAIHVLLGGGEGSGGARPQLWGKSVEFGVMRGTRESWPY